MKQNYTQAKKARRLNDYGAYQKRFFGTSVFMRRVQGILGADAAAFSVKHASLDMAVEGYKARLALDQQGHHNRV